MSRPVYKIASYAEGLILARFDTVGGRSDSFIGNAADRETMLNLNSRGLLARLGNNANYFRTTQRGLDALVVWDNEAEK